MPRPKMTPAQRRAANERRERADEWKMFRLNHQFTQRKLASSAHISRRTIQQIENAKITPRRSTLRIFSTFKQKHEDTNRTNLNWDKE